MIETEQNDPTEVPDGCMRMGPLQLLPQTLRGAGMDPERFLARASLDVARIGAPNRIISLEEAGRLFQDAAADSGCPWFGLLLGQQADLASLQKVNALVMRADTLGEALRLLERNLHRQNRGAMMTLSEADGCVTLAYVVYTPGVPAMHHYEDAAIAVAVNVLRGFCGAHWTPRLATFARRPPQDLRPYREFFRCKLRFDAEFTSIVFPRILLDLPLRPIFRLDSAEGMVDGHDALPFSTRIRRMVPSLLHSHHCSQTRVAERLGIHRRTLIRRLEEEGTSFRALADEVRFARAQHLLANTDIPIGDIASLLDYAEPSSFSRAFRRWAGVAPLHWRG
jgi:AraC-like DNA-binding protein